MTAWKECCYRRLSRAEHNRNLPSTKPLLIVKNYCWSFHRCWNGWNFHCWNCCSRWNCCYCC
ncbi:MAG: hypothetical protein K6T66_08725 [Peptococcaceae bacterium]|nr:hypothetical protein [Peptococcaceae bacterium]